MLMKRKNYRIILLPAVICTAVLSFISFYATGVVDKSLSKKYMGECLDIICQAADSKKEMAEKLNNEINRDYRSKARVVSMMLAKNTKIFADETSLEELRVAIGADVISISDESGIIRYSTDMSVAESKVQDEFMPGIENKVFSDTILSEYGGYKAVITGSSRLDEPGVIQIRFPLKSIQSQLEESAAVSEMPLLKNCHFAIIDNETYTYINHTDITFKGSAVQFPEDSFSDESGCFSSEYEGESVLVTYQKHNDYTAIGILPKSEVYRRRNTVFKWVLTALLLLMAVIFLAIRNYVLRKFKATHT